MPWFGDSVRQIHAESIRGARCEPRRSSKRLVGIWEVILPGSVCIKAPVLHVCSIIHVGQRGTRDKMNLEGRRFV